MSRYNYDSSTEELTPIAGLPEIDSQPVQDSTNPISSGAVYDIVNREPDVHVTSNGTINLRQFFKNVADAIDFTKVGKNTMLVEKRGSANSLYVLTNLNINDVAHTISGGFVTSSANGSFNYSFIISQTLADCYAHSFNITTAGNVNCTDQSTIATSNGDYIDVYY